MHTVSVSLVNDWLAYLQAFATAAGALVTAATVIFIWIQTNLTRRSVIATERSVKTTEAAQVLARSEFDRNTQLLADSQRARIDAEMPRLTIVAAQVTGAYRMDIMVENLYDPLEANGTPVKPGLAIFEMPRDADVPISVWVNAKVSNDGPRRALLHAGQDHSADRRVEKLSLGVGESYNMVATRIETLERWIDIAKIYIDGGDGREAAAGEADVLSLTYFYPGDTGAIERHVVMQGGSIVERIAGTTDKWTIAPFEEGRYGGLSTVAEPFTRAYYASFKENRLL